MADRRPLVVASKDSSRSSAVGWLVG